MHTFRDFRALRADTEQLDPATILAGVELASGQLAQDVESGFYLYEMARWSQAGPPLRVVGVFGILALERHGDSSLRVQVKDELSHRILAREGVSGAINTPWKVPQGLAKQGAGPIWAIADVGVIDEVLPYRIGPIARVTDREGFAHRLYALVQPAAIEMVTKAIEGAELVLADGHERLRAALEEPTGSPQGSTLELLCFICQAKDVSGLIHPVHRIFHGTGLKGWHQGLPAALGATGSKPEGDYVELVGEDNVAYIPVKESTSATIAAIENHLSSIPGTEIDFITDAKDVRSAIGGPGTLGMLCPAIPVAEIISGAQEGVPMVPNSAHFSPKPIPSMILGEASEGD